MHSYFKCFTKCFISKHWAKSLLTYVYYCFLKILLIFSELERKLIIFTLGPQSFVSVRRFSTVNISAPLCLQLGCTIASMLTCATAGPILLKQIINIFQLFMQLWSHFSHKISLDNSHLQG